VKAIRSSCRAAPDATRRWSHCWQSGGPMTIAKPSSNRSHYPGGRVTVEVWPFQHLQNRRPGRVAI
jgi:hypothetical protein